MAFMLFEILLRCGTGEKNPSTADGGGPLLSAHADISPTLWGNLPFDKGGRNPSTADAVLLPLTREAKNPSTADAVPPLTAAVPYCPLTRTFPPHCGGIYPLTREAGIPPPLTRSPPPFDQGSRNPSTADAVPLPLTREAGIPPPLTAAVPFCPLTRTFPPHCGGIYPLTREARIPPPLTRSPR